MYEKLSEHGIRNNNFLILGDFNLPHFNSECGSAIDNQALYRDIYSFMNVYHLTSTSHSKIKNSSNKTLNLILANFNHITVREGDSLTDVCDGYHPPLLMELYFLGFT